MPGETQKSWQAAHQDCTRGLWGRWMSLVSWQISEILLEVWYYRHESISHLVHPHLNPNKLSLHEGHQGHLPPYE